MTAWNNGQFVLVAKVINSSLALVAGTFNGQIAVVQALAQGAAVPEAKGLAVPIGGQITALFNQNSNYAQFLLNAIIPSIWSILLALYGLNTLAREDRHGAHWMPENRAAIGAKFLTHWLIGWAWGGLWSYGLYSLLDYPLNGSALLLVVSIGVTAGACVALGMAFYALIRDPARAVSIVGALMAPDWHLWASPFRRQRWKHSPRSGGSCCPSRTMAISRLPSPATVQDSRRSHPHWQRSPYSGCCYRSRSGATDPVVRR
nr:ABC transporter permease [Pectobacterium sp. PL152]